MGSPHSTEPVQRALLCTCPPLAPYTAPEAGTWTVNSFAYVDSICWERSPFTGRNCLQKDEWDNLKAECKTSAWVAQQ